MGELQHIHEYLRMTGSHSLHWFFFACTVNAATAGFLVQSTRINLEKIWLLPLLFVVCDLALAVGFSTWLPNYYYEQAEQIALLTKNGSNSPFPHVAWTRMAYGLAVTFLAMAAAWFWFFLWPKKIVDYLN